MLKPNCKHRLSGFSLTEILVATGVLMMIVVVLASALNQALGVWGRSENKSDLRENARVALNVIGRELQQAVLPLYTEDQNSLQMLISPSGISADFNHHDTIFWQAPIATNRDKGDLAIVGYFIRKDGNKANLCRLFINPNDAAYGIYSTPSNWLTDTLLNTKANPTEANYLQGILLENIPGMWVTAYSDTTNKYASYDSRVEKKLPVRVEISLALLSTTGAERLNNGAITLPDAAGCATVDEFMGLLSDKARPHIETVTVSVSFPR